MYYALDGLDERLEKYLDFNDGIFFEAGANDGERYSNTCYFARHRGWTGALVEPIVSRFDKCVRARPESKVFWAALVPPGWSTPYVELTFCDMMTVTRSQLNQIDPDQHVERGLPHLLPGDEPHQVFAPARTISSILDEAGIRRLDLLSLDLEGFEGPALQGINFSRHDIRNLIIECWNFDEINATLRPHYNMVAQLSYHDYLFVKRQ